MVNIYFQFKSELSKRSGETVLLSDLVDISCPEPYISKLNEAVAFPLGITGVTKVTAMQIIRLITGIIDNASINPIGSPYVLFEPAATADSKPHARLFKVFKVISGTVLLFIGSLLAVLYFHADVDMNLAHSIIYRAISGETLEKPLLMIIPYSLGVGIGIAVFFDVFNIKNKKHKPGPLELELYQAEREMKEYLTDLEEKADT